MLTLKKHKRDNEEIINDIVHGGTGWEGPLPNSKNQEVMKPYGECEYWGWDYGHIGDYQGQDNIFGDPTDKKWTSEEIVREIYRAIDSTEE